MTPTRMGLEDVDWTDQSPNRLEQIDQTPLIPKHYNSFSSWT